MNFLVLKRVFCQTIDGLFSIFLAHFGSQTLFYGRFKSLGPSKDIPPANTVGIPPNCHFLRADIRSGVDHFRWSGI